MMIDTHVRTIQRLHRAQKVRRTARLSRRTNAVVEFAVSVVSLLLLAGFILDLIDWSRNHDVVTALLHRFADFLVLPFHTWLSYLTVSFTGGVFSPIYLIAAATYILFGLATSALVRRLLR